MHEQLLIQRCKKKDASAQRSLYECYVKKIFLTVLRYIDDEMATEEVTADVFVKCFDKINGFEYRGEGSFYGWLKRIAVNESISHLRKRNLLWDELKEDRGTTQNEENYAETKMSHDEIIKTIRSLPDGYRMVFNLFAIEGFTHIEIAIKLNITVETSRSQLFKARKALQKLIKR